MGISHGAEILSEENELLDNPLPTSSFEVLRRCFVDKTNKDKYESVAGNLVLQEIFGVGFDGHLLAAKKLAREVGSTFLVIDSPGFRSLDGGDVSGETDGLNKMQGFFSSLAPHKVVGSVVSLASSRVALTSDIHS